MRIGDKLWFVQMAYNGREKGEGKDLTITKVGRLYAYSQAEWRLYKINLESLAVVDERGQFDGQCYPSKEAHEMEKLRQQEWKRLYQWIDKSWTAPDNVTLPEIIQIQVLLGMRAEVPEPRPTRDERAQFQYICP